MDYLFEARNFALTQTSVQFLRNKFPYKGINYDDIKSIQLIRGTEVKRPFVSIVFGLILISVALYLMVTFSSIPEGSFDSKASGKIVLGLLLIESFLIGLGGFSLFRALPVHDVVTFTLNNGKQESFDISNLIESKKVDLLVNHLTQLVDPGLVNVDDRYRS